MRFSFKGWTLNKAASAPLGSLADCSRTQTVAFSWLSSLLPQQTLGSPKAPQSCEPYIP